MAREIEAVVDEVDYVPDVGENRSDPDPFVVRLRPLTGAELKVLERAQGDFTVGKSVNFQERADRQIRQAFKARVVSVRGYRLRNRKGEPVEPKTGLELFDAIREHAPPSEEAVIDDIYQALTNHSRLRAGLPEALRSRSES